MVNFSEPAGQIDEQTFNQRVDDRIDRKLDRLKVWVACALLANLVPVLGISWWGGSTLAGIQGQLQMLAVTTPQAVTRTEFDLTRQELMRRADQNAERIKELEKRDGK